MNYTTEIVKTAADLPEDWDRIGIDYFQTKEFLLHTEKFNSCRQRYYLLFQRSFLKVGVVIYSLRLDLFTYLAMKSPFTMHIVGVPCSVSSSGIIGEEKLFSTLLEEVRKQEKGMLLMLNLDNTMPGAELLAGRTLPTMLFSNTFLSYAKYLSSIRAHYRRRLLKISEAFKGVEKKQLNCKDFTSEMHAQYLEVLKRSKGKLETLSQDFFQQLPPIFILTAYTINTQLLGWKITLSFGNKYYFFLGGIDYRVRLKFNTYFNLLLDVLNEGIESNAVVIDFGQTAEVPKMRLGCTPDEKKMLAHHSNPLFRKFLKVGKKALEYSTVVEEAHVFKTNI
jgi:hypothetical protein